MKIKILKQEFLKNIAEVYRVETNKDFNLKDYFKAEEKKAVTNSEKSATEKSQEKKEIKK